MFFGPTVDAVNRPLRAVEAKFCDFKAPFTKFCSCQFSIVYILEIVLLTKIFDTKKNRYENF